MLPLEAIALALGLGPGTFRAAEPADGPRPVLDLDGTWEFATDPERVGEAERWFLPGTPFPRMPREGYAPSADGRIRVPGIWNAQGYGTESEKVRHDFVGLGWYRRTVEIPSEWAGRRLFLRITGVHRYARIWVNGRCLGDHVGYLSEVEREITEAAPAGGSATIAIQVDSRQRWEVDTLFGAADLADYMDVAWGGIHGHVSIEARSPAWLADPFVRPRVSPPGARVSARIEGRADHGGSSAAALGRPDAVRLDVLDRAGDFVATRTVPLAADPAAGAEVEVPADLPGAALWSPERPILYTARLSLVAAGRTVDRIETRFGLREIRIDGYRILLNGSPIFLRGYGDDHIYPEQMARPADKELHLRRLRTIRDHGFNHVRHHSTILEPEYYDACDETGILATAEFPIAYSQFLPGGEVWKRSVPEGTDPKAAVDTYLKEWSAAIRRHRNHPSILAWVMGNELWDGVPLRHDFARISRTLDPTRPFADSDGVTQMWSRILDPGNDRDTLDLYFLMFDVGTNPIDNPAKFHTPEPRKPIVSHETGNYVTFSRPDLAREFRHAIKPFWLEPGIAKLEELGLVAEGDLWAERSERLYMECHKRNLEALRKSPFISGHHWWLFQDYWTSSNGIVDHYFRPKSIAAEEVRRVVSDVVLLEDGLGLTHRGGEAVETKLLVSTFAPAPLNGTLRWSAELGGERIAAGEAPIEAIPPGNVRSVGVVRLELPSVSAPLGLALKAELHARAPERRLENSWTARVYPAAPGPPPIARKAYADGRRLARWPELALRPLPVEGDLPADAVYVSGTLDRRLLAAVERGARAVLVDEAGAILPSREVTWRTSWWKAGDRPEANCCGTVAYEHPATKAMAPAGWCDAGWFHLLEGARKLVLEGAPCRPRVLVRALPSLALVEDSALLFEVRVGRGSLIVSGLHHERARGRPEDLWLVRALIEHAATSEPPAEAWPASFLPVEEPPPPGPHLAGFIRLTRMEGETGRWHSYREDDVTFHVCRQTKPGNLLEWETAPAPPSGARPDPGPAVTFVFAGGLGWASEPATEGFELFVAGTPVLRFDLVQRQGRWASADGKVVLSFAPRRTLPLDRVGLFHVTVDRGLLRPGEPARLGVRSLGSGSRRWFGLNEYEEGLREWPRE